MPAPYKVAILTVSDTAAKDASTDKTGPLLADVFAQQAAFEPALTAIVPDEVDDIRKQVSGWSQSGVALCVTTGGTGFAKRDITPEAVRPLIVKEATGFQHLMMQVSLQKTPMAALARPVAGVTKDGMIVFTVPGSPKGAVENVEALLKLLPHALDLASGGSGKEVHAAMGMPVRSDQASSHQDHGHTCGHSHSHNLSHTHAKPRTLRSMDTSKGASARHRKSQYPIISLQEAYSHILDNTTILSEIDHPVNASLTGYILAEDIHAEQDLPSTNTTNVDGYAVVSADTPEGTYPVLTTQNYTKATGGSLLDTAMPAGYICRINTGGPLPKGADAVVMVEDTELVSTTEDGEEKKVKLLAQVSPGENVRKPGSDVRRGDQVLSKGSRISEVGGELGTLAFIGKREAKVNRKPVVAIMSTGNEISDLHATASHTNGPVIYDSNRPSLQAVLESHGFEVVDLGIISDDAHDTETALRRGCRDADVIIATGGTSMGEADMLKPVIERNLQGTIHFGRVAMKPGKPTTFATIPASSLSNQQSGHLQRDKQVFALPGNPASALVTFHLFVLPCLRKLSGYPESQWHLPTVKVQATSAMHLDPRPEFHRVTIEPISEPPYLIARSTGGQRSSRTVSLAYANGLVCLPSSEGADKTGIAAGDIVDAILIGKL